MYPSMPAINILILSSPKSYVLQSRDSTDMLVVSQQAALYQKWTCTKILRSGFALPRAVQEPEGPDAWRGRRVGRLRQPPGAKGGHRAPLPGGEPPEVSDALRQEPPGDGWDRQVQGAGSQP